MELKKHKSILDALNYVANHPVQSAEATIDAPVWELVSRRLFFIANSPDKKVRGSMARATRAQKILLERMVGRRRAGTHPAQTSSDTLDFVDLTVGILPAAEEQADDN